LANRNRTIGIVILAILIFGLLSSVGLYLSDRSTYSEREVRQLIARAYSSQRPGGGRLAGASYTPLGNTAVPTEDLGKAQILVLRQPDSRTRRRLQGLLSLSAGEWQRFVDLASDPQPSGDGDLLNNLGTSYLALSNEDPGLLLKARDTFEDALKAAPKAKEPLFNLVITYRRLHIPSLAAERLQQYSAEDPDSAWQKELANPVQRDERSIVDQLERLIGNNDLIEAEHLFLREPELCRRIAMQYALYNAPESTPLVRFIANQMEHHYGDKTISALIAPLFTDQRDATIAFRRRINEGADLFQNADYRESLAVYSELAPFARTTSSVFDRLWLDLNQVDTEIKLGKFEHAREILGRLSRTATAEGFLWLNARALSIYGSTTKLTPSYTQMLSLLSQANEEFTRLDAPHDRIRLLYYLGAYRYYGGDQDEALKLAVEGLRLVGDNEPIRISAFDWLVGAVLYRQGLAEQSLLFAKESVEQIRKVPNAPSTEVPTLIILADMYQSLSRQKLADESLKAAEEALLNFPEGFDRTRNELLLGTIKAKARIARKQYPEAETQLQRNLDLYSQQPFSATALLSQSLMLLAQVYSETGRLNEANRKFTEAINIVEQDDEYMKSESFRVKFDDQRRDLYDSAIAFEFSHGSLDAAWSYLQKYRAKLFLEFLAAFNPNIRSTQAIDRATLQQRIPKDTQIVEYVLLKDRVLIWLLTEKSFTVKSVEVGRKDVEASVEEVLARLRNGTDAVPLLSELGKWLIEPIGNLLDPNRTIVIIPDRALHGLPFAALRMPGKTRYLIEDFPVVVSPSLTHFLTIGSASPSRDAIVGFGSQNGSSAEFKELAALNDIYLKAATYQGSQVDKSSFLEALGKTAIFHYAGHSATDAADPLRSSILLDGNRSGPNSVTAVDISHQHLVSNSVVILSSCDSSVGNSRDGVGMRGLTSAFLIGGAGSVVGSLWTVEASSTSDLMIRFHRAFAKSRMPVAQALREAQLSFLKAYPERSHPYYWSGFEVTGNISALR
jgi:CHAT domain-containing protein